MLKDNTYIVIPSWAITKFNLKGNSLLIFSLIYGFSQDDESCFKGSLEYIQEWTNSTRQGVINTLKQLIEDKLIIKEKSFPNNKYYVNKNKLFGCKETLHSCKETLHNNIDNNIDISISKDIDINNSPVDININSLDKKENNKYIAEKELQNQIEEVVAYMNNVFNTRFKSKSNGTKKHIKARLKEGYKFSDFKDVIDFKWKEWGVNPVKFSTGQMSNTYLRPSTLFGNKFDEYLQASWLSEFNTNKVESIEKSNNRSNLSF